MTAIEGSERERAMFYDISQLVWDKLRSAPRVRHPRYYDSAVLRFLETEAQTWFSFVRMRMDERHFMFYVRELNELLNRKDDKPSQEVLIGGATAFRMMYVHFQVTFTHPPGPMLAPSTWRPTLNARSSSFVNTAGNASSSPSSSYETSIVETFPHIRSRIDNPANSFESVLATDVGSQLITGYQEMRNLSGTNRSIRSLLLGDHMEAIREMHAHHKVHGSFRSDHLFARIFQSFLRIDDGGDTAMVIEDMRILREKTAILSELSNIRVLCDFESDIIFPYVHTLTISYRYTGEFSKDVDEELRFCKSMYYPFADTFNLNFEPQRDFAPIFASFATSYENGCFPNLQRLIVEDPLDEDSLCSVLSIGASFYASNVKEISIVLTAGCNKHLEDDEISRKAHEYRKCFPELKFLQVEYKSTDFFSPEIDYTCGVDEIQSFLMFKELEEIRFPVELPVRHTNLHTIATRCLRRLHLSFDHEHLPSNLIESVRRFSENNFDSMQELLIDSPYIPGIIANMKNIEKIVRFRHLHSNEYIKWGESDLVACIEDIKSLNVDRVVDVYLSDFSDIRTWTHAANVLATYDASRIRVHGAMDCSLQRSRQYHVRSKEFDIPWPKTGDIDHSSYGYRVVHGSVKFNPEPHTVVFKEYTIDLDTAIKRRNASEDELHQMINDHPVGVDCEFEEAESADDDD